MRVSVVLLLGLLAACISSRSPQSPPPLSVAVSPTQRAQQDAQAPRFMVTTQGVETSQAAFHTAQDGGNLVDAAIAASFAVAVERPQSTGIGGGGFFIYREAKTGKIHAFDFRERAPAKAFADMYLNAKGEVQSQASIDGIRAVAIPGLVAGLSEIHARFGRSEWSKILQPAIRLAEEGFRVYPDLARALKERQEVLRKNPDALRIFFRPDGTPLQEGDWLVQKDLAQTLRSIAARGRAGFYEGGVRDAILKESERQGGLLSVADFKNYRVLERTPVRGEFRGYEIVSMPPPSSGGTHIIEILHILESLNISHKATFSAERVHQVAAAQQAAFADRAEYMGDPDSVKVPVKELTSMAYARKIAAAIPAGKARRADEVRAGDVKGVESQNTTHMTLMDRDGNVIVTTQTINGLMGSGVVAQGTGIVLNNEMDDFSAKTGAQNLFGAVGGVPNAIAPGKRPLSSMSPTIILNKGKPVLALGSPGGTRILTCVALTLWNRLEFGWPLFESVASVRYHHQWKPDQLEIEDVGLGRGIESQLEHMGYTLKKVRPYCRVNAIERLPSGELHGVADPRDIGWAMGF